jgi:hypothetical protein
MEMSGQLVPPGKQPLDTSNPKEIAVVRVGIIWLRIGPQGG